jgi:dihydropyrimidinase
MNVDYSAYEGRRVQGVVRTVLSRGEVILENGSFQGRPGRGSYLKRKTRFDD